MKVKNVRRRQARKYDRYLERLQRRVSQDVWFRVVPSVFFRLNPEFRPTRYHPKASIIVSPELENHIQTVVAEALEEEIKKENDALPVAPPIQVEAPVNEYHFEELFG